LSLHRIQPVLGSIARVENAKELLIFIFFTVASYYHTCGVPLPQAWFSP